MARHALHAQLDLYIFSGDDQSDEKQHYFDSELFTMVKFEKVYFSFQAFGIFDFKDTMYLMLLRFETITV